MLFANAKRQVKPNPATLLYNQVVQFDKDDLFKTPRDRTASMGEKKQKLTFRKIQAEKTKQRLIEAGAKLIKDTRYEDISIEDIAHSAGVSKGTFYVHFESKDQFFYSVCHADYASLQAILADDAEPLYLERLRNYCREWVLLNETMSVHYMQHWFSHMLDESFHMQVTGTPSSVNAFREGIGDCIASAQANGEIAAEAPASMLTDYALVMLYGFDAFSVLSKQDVSVSEWANFLADSIVDDVLGSHRPAPDA